MLAWPASPAAGSHGPASVIGRGIRRPIGMDSRGGSAGEWSGGSCLSVGTHGSPNSAESQAGKRHATLGWGNLDRSRVTYHARARNGIEKAPLMRRFFPDITHDIGGCWTFVGLYLPYLSLEAIVSLSRWKGAGPTGSALRPPISEGDRLLFPSFLS